MGTSAEYINMCEKASEIQEQWKPKEHDMMATKYKSEYQNEDGTICVRHHIPCTVFDVFDMRKRVGKDYHWIVWLPRQDQLQEMLQPCGFITLLREFSQESLLRIREEPYDSMEKLWLAFVMKEKYNKVWNGEDWVVN